MARGKRDINKINNEDIVNTLNDDEKTRKKVEKVEKVDKKHIDDINKIDDLEKTIVDGLQIVDILDATKDKIKKAKNTSQAYLFCRAFMKRIKEDKLYFLSLVITILFLVTFSINKLDETAGIYDRKHDNNVVENDKKDDETVVKSDDVDVSSYVGFYSREVTLNNEVFINETCNIEDYKLVYEIRSDKKITKYLVSDCMGTIKMWSDTLTYVSTGGARYISANDINFLFSASSMKEVDAETYKLDDSITSIKESKLLDNTDIQFYNNAFIIRTLNDLILIKGSSIGYQLSSQYNTILNNGLDTVYKTNNKGTYKFIDYSDIDSKKCYGSDEIKDNGDKDLYKIYSIKYNDSTGTFNKAKEIISRKVDVSCSIVDSDIASLKE